MLLRLFGLSVATRPPRLREGGGVAHGAAQPLVALLAHLEGSGRPRLEVLVAERRLRRPPRPLGRDRARREPAACDEEAGVAHHPVVGADGEAVDVPAADQPIGRAAWRERGAGPGAAVAVQ